MPTNRNQQQIMPRLDFAKETIATCNHAPNRRRKAVISILLVSLVASIGGLITGCILEVRWAIIVGILGIGANILGLFIAMDSMRKEYIKSRDQAYTIDHVTVIKDEPCREYIDDEMVVIRVV